MNSELLEGGYEQLEAHLRRGMLPGPEGHPGVERHDDVSLPPCKRVPGWCDHQAPPDPHGSKKLLPAHRPPAIVKGSGHALCGTGTQTQGSESNQIRSDARQLCLEGGVVRKVCAKRQAWQLGDDD